MNNPVQERRRKKEGNSATTAEEVSIPTTEWDHLARAIALCHELFSLGSDIEEKTELHRAGTTFIRI